MPLKPYLQLVRLPNLFTAAADPLAGWLVATGSLALPGRWGPLVAASVLIYAAGIVLNDVFDVEVDRRERPGRPLPSGRVPYRLAAWFGGLALLAGPAVAALSGSRTSALVAGLLALAVLLYDAGLKRTPVGPIAMGTCRALNLLLGLSQAEHLGGLWGWIIAGSFGLFVVGVTWISRSEVEPARTGGIMAGLLLQLLGIFLLLYPASFYGGLLKVPHRYPVVAFAVSVVLAFLVVRAGMRALLRPVPPVVQAAVKTGVLSLVWLDVVAVAATRGPVPALAVAALWLPAFLLAKWLYAT